MGLFDFLKGLFGGSKKSSTGTKKKSVQFHAKLSGVTHEGRQGLIASHCKEGMTVMLRRDKGNKHDKNAIGVWVPAGMIGWIPADSNRRLAQAMDAGQGVSARIKNVTGGTKQKPTRGVNIEIRVG